MEVLVRSNKKVLAAPEPTEYMGVPIIARLLVDAEDIAKISSSKLSLSLKSTFFSDYQKGSLIDLIFLMPDFDKSVYRYRIVSKGEDCINFRLECII